MRHLVNAAKPKATLQAFSSIVMYTNPAGSTQNLIAVLKERGAQRNGNKLCHELRQYCNYATNHTETRANQTAPITVDEDIDTEDVFP